MNSKRRLRHRWRTRRVLKWVATSLCVVVAVLAVAARSCRLVESDGRLVGGWIDGTLWVMWAPDPNGYIHVDDGPDVSWRYLHLGSELRVVAIPEWLVFLLVGGPTALLWWLDRRRFRPGQCQGCGYDLTGNVSGRCPECGRLIDSR